MIDIQGASILMHGPPGVGKTQVATSFPEPVQFIATEFGHKYIPDEQRNRIVQCEMGDAGWKLFLQFLDKEVIKQREVKTLCIDTVGMLYDSCMDYVCLKNNWKHPADAGHGNGWKALRREFTMGLGKLQSQCHKVNATMLFLEHSMREEIKTFAEYHRFASTLSGQAKGIVNAAMDFIWFYSFEAPDSKDALKVTGDTRTLYLGGTEYAECKTRDKAISKAKIFKILDVPIEEQYTYILQSINQEAALAT